MSDESPDPEPLGASVDATLEEHRDDAEALPVESCNHEPAVAAPQVPATIDVHDLDWPRIASAMRPAALRARMRSIVEELEARLDSDRGVPRLFDDQREAPSDRVLKITELSDAPLWFIGDLHGDLLALDAALALISAESGGERPEAARIVLLGDLCDDGGYGLETVLRVFELMLERSQSVCLLAGNHDEALGYNGGPLHRDGRAIGFL